MKAPAFKSFLMTLPAALLVGAAVYGIARLAGAMPPRAENFALIAVLVGLLEKPLLWLLRRSGIIAREK